MGSRSGHRRLTTAGTGQPGDVLPLRLAEHLSERVTGGRLDASHWKPRGRLREAVEATEREIIQRAFDAHDGNKTHMSDVPRRPRRGSLPRLRMAFFDTFAEHQPTRVGWWLMRSLNRHHVRVLSSLRQPIRRIAEIGPGMGAFADACREASLTHAALEANPGICSALSRSGHTAVRSLVPPMPLADGSVDVAHASHVIEHSPTFREAAALVRECHRVVAPGGLVSLVAPDFDHLGNEFYKAHYSHSTPMTMRRMTQLLVDNELEVRHAEYLSGPFRGGLRYLTQLLAWASSARTIWILTLGRLPMAQCYSAKMTFMRAVWVVGVKAQRHPRATSA